MPHGRRRVNKQRYVATLLGDRSDRLSGAHFVIRRLNRSYSDTGLPYGVREGFLIYPAPNVHPDFNTLVAGTVENGRVLDGRVDDGGSDAPPGSADRGQAGLDGRRTGSRQVELVRAYSDRIREHRAGVVQQQPGGPSFVVQTHRIGPSGIHCRQQHFPCCRVHRLRRCRVQIPTLAHTGNAKPYLCARTRKVSSSVWSSVSLGKGKAPRGFERHARSGGATGRFCRRHTTGEASPAGRQCSGARHPHADRLLDGDH